MGEYKTDQPKAILVPPNNIGQFKAMTFVEFNFLSAFGCDVNVETLNADRLTALLATVRALLCVTIQLWWRN